MLFSFLSSDESHILRALLGRKGSHTLHAEDEKDHPGKLCNAQFVMVWVGASVLVAWVIGDAEMYVGILDRLIRASRRCLFLGALWLLQQDIFRPHFTRLKATWQPFQNCNSRHPQLLSD